MATARARAGGRGAAAALLMALAAAACMHRGAPPTAVAAPVQPLPALARLYDDNSGAIQDTARLVIRDAVRLKDIWTRATSAEPNTAPPVPAVDFGREMVLVVGAGRMSPADQISVDSVAVRKQTTPEGRTEEVLAAWVSIIQGCQHVQGVAFPFEIVKVRRYDGPVSFAVQRVRAGGCT